MCLNDGQTDGISRISHQIYSYRITVGQTRPSLAKGNTSVAVDRWFYHCLRKVRSACSSPPAPPGQFLLEESRLLEAAEMAETAARLDSEEFDVVFSAAHMLRWVFHSFHF